MSDTMSILVSGYGGQGILFAGKLIAYAGLMDGKEVSWLPSYGPEMRGGDANCTVCLSDTPIASPYVQFPEHLMAMNQLAYNKYISMIKQDGIVIYDRSIINGDTDRKDLSIYGFEAAGIAEENGMPGLVNMVMTGRLYKELPFCSFDSLEKAMEKCVPERPQLAQMNMKAIQLGMES